MSKVFITLIVICSFGMVLSQTFAKNTVLNIFMNKAEICRKKVGASEC